MIVFVLIERFPQEGSEVLGIYSTKEKAEEVMNNTPAYQEGWTVLDIQEWEVDNPNGI